MMSNASLIQLPADAQPSVLERAWQPDLFGAVDEASLYHDADRWGFFSLLYASESGDGRRKYQRAYPLVKLAQTARTCIYGHLEEHHVIDPAVSHLEMDDNVPGREHELGRPRHAMSVMSALAL